MDVSGAVGHQSVADRLIARLLHARITTVFGVHGANIEDVFDAAVRNPCVRPVVTKHEFGAGAMADGLARIHGVPTAVLTTSGGGALNVIPALGEAYDSRVPVVAVIGTAARPTVGRGGFQDMLCPPDTIDLTTVLSGVVGSCSVVDDPASLDDAVDDALETLSRNLPAALVIPKDVQAARIAVGPVGSVTAPERGGPPTDVIAGLADRLAHSVRRGEPVCIWAGEEASRLGSSGTIGHLADLLGASVVVSPGGRDVAGPGCAGVTGVMGHPSAHAAVQEATVCLVLGCRMSLTDRAGLDETLATTCVFHVGAVAPRAPGVADHIETLALDRALVALTQALHDRLPGPRGAHPRDIRYLPDATSPSRSPVLPTLREIVTTIGDVLPTGCAVFADAGDTGAAAIHHLPFGSGRFVVALGMGGMGFAIAAGIGAAIGGASGGGGPDRTVVIAGDGSFFMHGMELHTAIEHDAPVTLIVLNNDAHGMCVTRENLYFPNTASSSTAPTGIVGRSVNRFRHTDIAAGLDAMFPDLVVRRATDVDTLRAAAADLLSRPGPNCIVVDTDPDEIAPFAPFLPRGTA